MATSTNSSALELTTEQTSKKKRKEKNDKMKHITQLQQAQ